MTNYEALHRLPASDVKKKGWRAVVRETLQRGSVVVTNHAEPEAVVLSLKEYSALVSAAERHTARAASELDALRQSFDERLAVLQEPDAPKRLRSVMRGPVKLAGKVKAGAASRDVLRRRSK